MRKHRECHERWLDDDNHSATGKENERRKIIEELMLDARMEGLNLDTGK